MGGDILVRMACLCCQMEPMRVVCGKETVSLIVLDVVLLRYRRLVESLLIMLVTSTVTVFAPLNYECTPIQELYAQADGFNVSTWSVS